MPRGVGVLRSPRVREPPQSTALALVDRLEGMPECLAAPGLHLDDAEHLVVRGEIGFFAFTELGVQDLVELEIIVVMDVHSAKVK